MIRTAMMGWAIGVAIGAALFLTGCGTPGPARVITQDVKAPVATSCVPPNLPDPPTYADIDAVLAALPSADARYQAVLVAREQRKARLGEVEPVIAGCRK